MRPETTLLVFDVETTGRRRDHDQIIELAVQAGMGADAPRHTWRFRPSVPIDPEAQKVHGISVQDLMGERPFAAYAARLHRMFSRAEVLAGYNIARFDLDMLQAEFRRAGVGAIELGDKLIVDAYRLWTKLEPRGLTQAHRRFVGTDHEGAHRAAADVTATAAVLEAMIATFGLQGASWADLAQRCGPDGRFHYVEYRDGTPILGFGKHAGRALLEIAAGPDRDYLQWVLQGDFPDGFKRMVREALGQQGGC